MSKKNYISNGQLRTLKALDKYTTREGEPPTVIDLSMESGYSATWTATLLKQLDNQGFIKRSPGWRQTVISPKGARMLRGSK